MTSELEDKPRSLVWQKPSVDHPHLHLLPPHPSLPAYASREEVRSILEFRKGIKSDPSDLVFFSWVAPASVCYDDLYDVVCYTAASTVVVVTLDGLGLTYELNFWIPARRSVISTDRVCLWRCKETKGDRDLGHRRWMGKGDPSSPCSRLSSPLTEIKLKNIFSKWTTNHGQKKREKVELIWQSHS
ncbi:leucine-rich receptor-like protein kinase family protein [Striga asiatica]|uniref:Leucine-rich receptor-like protein kinase family protein n=1 Tax=Striga asiatica TaxID=4170 RepID=A0A5A7NZ51_STRAF|nr:leucine-rich receptor-like protein kinase family protein [Striga asiatica]